MNNPQAAPISETIKNLNRRLERCNSDLKEINQDLKIATVMATLILSWIILGWALGALP